MAHLALSTSSSSIIAAKTTTTSTWRRSGSPSLSHLLHRRPLSRQLQRRRPVVTLADNSGAAALVVGGGGDGGGDDKVVVAGGRGMAAAAAAASTAVAVTQPTIVAKTAEELRRIDERVRRELAAQTDKDFLPATILLSCNAVCHIAICSAACASLAALCAAPPVAPLLANWASMPTAGAAVEALATAAKAIAPTAFLLFTSLGLIVDNAMLAMGRFVGPNAFFRELSRIRFLVHASTPAVTFVGLSISYDAGMRFPPLVMAALTLITVGLMLHTLKKAFKWTLMPAEARGVMHYTPTDTKVDLMRLLPVILPMVILLVDSWRTVLFTGCWALWPYPVCMTIMFLLGSLPGKVAPHFLAGNLGEVFFTVGLLAARGVADKMFVMGMM